MKLLVFSDTHSDMAAVSKLIKKAKSEGVDALLCAGDISEFGENIVEIFRQLDLGLPMIYIPGNHEDEGSDVSRKFKYVKNIHKKTLVLGGVLFLGCAGGGFSKFFTPFDKLIPKFKDAMAKHKGPTVLVTHAPPYKTKLDQMGRMDVGAEPIKRFITSAHPDYAISGHIHENAGKQDKVGKTVLINPGPEGVIINL